MGLENRQAYVPPQYFETLPCSPNFLPVHPDHIKGDQSEARVAQVLLAMPQVSRVLRVPWHSHGDEQGIDLIAYVTPTVDEEPVIACIQVKSSYGRWRAGKRQARPNVIYVNGGTRRRGGRVSDTEIQRQIRKGLRQTNII